eukprot:CAMPEP_0204076054 /NCGR_PEP_ID=MMETSP0360-20130528/167298_1 /ASSEMBLY_ACC=CAM_ASM_000342 /TAXON_ID=268821 /ORGANISM="Scrippsiella Hangoei, Strain SHTV-5" /LENGTH=119 /DNA_ID=CAMNT_0051024583 /DNA_START=80 /DNA_END=436 /DNA_ORIENTATION=-
MTKSDPQTSHTCLAARSQSGPAWDRTPHDLHWASADGPKLGQHLRRARLFEHLLSSSTDAWKGQQGLELFGSCILSSHLIIASTSVASFAAVVVYKDGRPGLPWFEGPKGLNAVKARAV